MQIPFRKTRLLNSTFIINSKSTHLTSINRYALSVEAHEFSSNWNTINELTEKVFRFTRKEIWRGDVNFHKEEHKVICVMAYLKDHGYLLNAVKSIARQTRKPDSVVIGIDNSSKGENSCDLQEALSCLEGAGISLSIKKFTGLNGPYHILNTIVYELDDSAYLWLHDSDDISHPTRLEKQLNFMVSHQLDMCGSFELRFDQTGFELIQYPINVSRALMTEPGHCMLWPASLIRIGLWRRISGCSDFYRFGADTEFQLRACFVARIGNTPSFLYARRKRQNSLTTSEQTGLRSWIRGYINSIYKAEYYQRQIIRSSGKMPLLSPRFIKDCDRGYGIRSIEELTETIDRD